MPKKKHITEDVHSENLQEIISKPPSWLLKRGISFVMLTVLIILALSAFIRYPEILSNRMKITTNNAPKIVKNRISGNLVNINVKDGEEVQQGQVLAYMESTAQHEQALALLNTLLAVRQGNYKDMGELKQLTFLTNLQLGELQGAYQNFYQAYLSYQSAKEGGAFLERRNIIEKEMKNIAAQKEHMLEVFDLQSKEIGLAKIEFEKYRLLAEKKVISPMELQAREVALLSKMKSVPQTENNILNNQAAYLLRMKELAELDNQIEAEKKRFVQSMNSLISEAENWKQQYILSAPSAGKVVFGSVLQENQYLTANEDVFYIYRDENVYFGEMYLPQSDFGKIKEGQDVLIKVRSYPYEEYGYLRGKIKTISDIPVKDSVFLSIVELLRTPQDTVIKLKPGVLADADIITEDQTVLYRIWKNVIKNLKRN